MSRFDNFFFFLIFMSSSLFYISLSPITDFLGERIESQLNLRNPKLVQWFRTLELPRIAGMFIPLFKKWSVDYAGRYVLKDHCFVIRLY